jgi:hypothetical protein
MKCSSVLRMPRGPLEGTGLLGFSSFVPVKYTMVYEILSGKGPKAGR